MYEDNYNEQAHKLVISFITGLLIGGLLMWTFAVPYEPNTSNTTLQQKAFDACVNQGGIPILDHYQNINSCQKLNN